MATSTAFPADRVARGLAIKTSYDQPEAGEAKGRPVSIFVYGIPAASVSVASTPYEFVSLADTATKYGYKSTIYQMCKMLKPLYGIGVGSIPITIFPLAVTTGGQAAGDITPTGTVTSSQTYYIKVNNQLSLPITMTGATGAATVADFCDLAVAALNGVVDMPGTATDGTTTVDFEVGYETGAGDFVYLEVVSPTDAELTFSYTQPTGGSGSVDISTVWSVFNDNWYSHVVNGADDATGSTILDSADTFGELRWGSTVHKPFKHYTGSNEATAATIRAITDARTDDRTNSIKWTPGSNDAPWVIAARMIGVQAPVQQADPAQDPQLRRCDFLTAGPDASQLDSDARDLAVKDGLSTVEIVDEKVYISDSVMCYHPAGEDPPAYRYDVDIEKECAMIYNINAIFTNSDDAGNPLIPDVQATTNANARKPSYFKQKLDALFDAAALSGIISDPEYAKENTTVSISSTNPKRQDVIAVYKLSGNLSVISVDNVFSFYLG